MTASEEPPAHSNPEAVDMGVPAPKDSQPLLARVDLLAIMIAAVGLVLAGAAGFVLAFIELTKLVRNFWADPVERWLVIIFAVALVWVTLRWKKSRI
jgi:hypothetical protein